MSRFWNSTVRRLTPYVPGEQPRIAGLIKLNTNENPYGPSPQALAAMRAEIDDGLRLYPDPHATRLKDALSVHFGVAAANIFVGNSSDEVLAHVFLGLLKQERKLLLPDITYSFYPVYCGLYGIEYETIPLDADFAIRIDDYLDHRDGAPGAIIFANPNAPTGRALPIGEIDRLAAGLPDTVIVVDEAYVDFGGESAVALLARRDNLLVVQTLSKSRSLAGLRVGFAIGSVDLIEALERVKNCFNSYPLDRIAIAGAAAAIEDRDWFERTRSEVVASRERLAASLAESGFEVLPSATNFLFARHPERDAGELAMQLRARKVLVRHFRQPRIDQFLRISIGSDGECDALMAALREILAAR